MHQWYESNRFSSSKTYFISKTSPNDQRAQGGKADEDDVNKSLRCYKLKNDVQKDNFSDKLIREHNLKGSHEPQKIHIVAKRAAKLMNKKG